LVQPLHVPEQRRGVNATLVIVTACVEILAFPVLNREHDEIVYCLAADDPLPNGRQRLPALFLQVGKRHGRHVPDVHAVPPTSTLFGVLPVPRHDGHVKIEMPSPLLILPLPSQFSQSSLTGAGDGGFSR
jgi:hypothetical protein